MHNLLTFSRFKDMLSDMHLWGYKIEIWFFSLDKEEDFLYFDENLPWTSCHLHVLLSLVKSLVSLLFLWTHIFSISYFDQRKKLILQSFFHCKYGLVFNSSLINFFTTWISNFNKSLFHRKIASWLLSLWFEEMYWLFLSLFIFLVCSFCIPKSTKN